MKNQSLFLLALLAMAMTACMENGLLDDEMNAEAGGTSLFSTASYDATTEALASANFEDIDETTDQAMERFFGSANGRLNFNKLDCAVVTRDSVNQVIIVDFGDGCEDRKGTIRSGMIIVSYTGVRNEPGASREVTFENFFIDSVQVEGTRTVTNTSDTANANVIVHEATLIGGKLTFADGTTLTREAAHTRTKYRGETSEENYVTLIGNASGELQDDTPYTMDIVTEILITGACNIKVPISGIKEFVAGENSLSIDFGDGTCDNLADVTLNGETRTIELKERSFGNHKGNRGKRKRG